MLKLTQIHKSFGKEEILRGISLEIPRGSRCCIVGPSGTGKSVLLKIILGLLKQDRGEVIFDGVATSNFGHKEWHALMQRIGLVFQGAALFDSIPIWENVGLRFLEEGKMTKNAIREQVAASLERVRLSPDIMDKSPAELSGGMQKRVGIARAIIHQPRYVFYDEPTTGLDPVSAGAVDELIFELSDSQDQTSVIVTHDLISVRKIATQVVMLQGGKVVFDGEKAAFWGAEEEAVQAFLRRAN